MYCQMQSDEINSYEVNTINNTYCMTAFNESWIEEILCTQLRLFRKNFPFLWFSFEFAPWCEILYEIEKLINPN